MDAFERNHVQVGGQGDRPLVLGHGLGGDSAASRFVAPAFEPRWRTVRYDHVGSGQSRLSAYDAQRHGTLDGFASDLIEVLEQLDAGPVAYVGHSVGGMIGMLAAGRRPELFDRLVLLASSPCFIDHLPEYQGGFNVLQLGELFELLQRNQLGWAATIAPMAMGEEAGPVLTNELREGLGALNPLVANRFGRLAFYSDLRDRLDAVRTPTLVVQCARDAAVPVSVGRFVHARIAGSRYVELDIAGHCPHLSHPPLTIETLSAFLEEARGG